MRYWLRLCWQRLCREVAHFVKGKTENIELNVTFVKISMNAKLICITVMSKLLVQMWMEVLPARVTSGITATVLHVKIQMNVRHLLILVIHKLGAPTQTEISLALVKRAFQAMVIIVLILTNA